VEANQAPVTEWLIHRSTKRITKPATAIRLKDYSSFVRSKRSAGMMTGVLLIPFMRFL
jgi:hypothetical protein